MKKTILWILTITLLLVCVGCSTQTTNEPEITDEPEPTEEVVEEIVEEVDIAERVENAQDFNSEDLIRNPSEYLDTDLWFYGEIKKIYNDGDTQKLFVKKGGGEEIEVIYTPKEGESRYLKKDEVIVYGTFTGNFTQTNKPIFDAFSVIFAYAESPEAV